MSTRPIFGLIFSLLTLFAQADDRGFHLRLKDMLDRPQDGYCLDVAGSGQYVRFDMPLTAHNCKGPHFYADEEVTFKDSKNLYFPAYEGCVTVMGNNQKALPKNALMLKRCGAEEPFMNGPVFQHFAFTDDGKVQLVGSNLCMVAGDESHTTYSPDHRWRALYMERCSDVVPKLAQWELVKPKGH